MKSCFGVSRDEPQCVDVRSKPGLHQFDRFDDDKWGTRSSDEGSNFGDDCWMGDAIQIGECLGIGEDHTPQRGAVNLTVWPDNRRSKPVDDPLKDSRSWHQKGSIDAIGVDDLCAALAKHLRNCRFSRGNRTGQPDHEWRRIPGVPLGQRDVVAFYATGATMASASSSPFNSSQSR